VSLKIIQIAANVYSSLSIANSYLINRIQFSISTKQMPSTSVAITNAK